MSEPTARHRSRRGTRRPCSRGAFTLVELLVVIGIIAVLVSILLPSLGRAGAQAREVVCMNNLKQWGTGFQMYINQSRGAIPWEGAGDGDKPSKALGPWNSTMFWANAVPPLVNGTPYYDLQQADAAGGYHLPKSGDASPFVCPAAGDAAAGPGDTVGDGYFMMFGNREPPGPGVDQRKVYWCYVFNSKLNNSQSAGVKIQQIRQSTEVPLLVEKMMSPGEISPPYNDSLSRGKTTWTRFTARHRKGGYLMFADGHVGFLTRDDANRSDPNTGDFNQPGLVVWNPFGPA